MRVFAETLYHVALICLLRVSSNINHVSNGPRVIFLPIFSHTFTKYFIGHLFISLAEKDIQVAVRFHKYILKLTWNKILQEARFTGGLIRSFKR